MCLIENEMKVFHINIKQVCIKIKCIQSMITKTAVQCNVGKHEKTNQGWDILICASNEPLFSPNNLRYCYRRLYLLP